MADARVSLVVGFSAVAMAWRLAIFPGLAIMVTVLSINFIGDGLRDILDVKMSRAE